MADEWIAGMKAPGLVGMVGGASAAAMLMSGPWHLRCVAGMVGGIFTVVGTLVFAPIVEGLVAHGYTMVGVEVARMPVDSVTGLTGFVLGLTGIDASRWIIERTKGALLIIKLPWWAKPPN